MTMHRYQRGSLTADYLRGGGGLLLTAGPLGALPMHWVLALLFGGAALTFALFVGRTAQRQMTVVETSDRGIIARGPFGTAIPWNDLTGLKLRYYSTRRDRERGWMHLTLEGRGRRKMRLESTLDDFDAIVDRAADAARRNGVALGDATVGNLVAMGITAPRDEPWRRWAGLGKDPGEDPGEDLGEDLGQCPGNGEQHRPPSVTVGERQ